MPPKRKKTNKPIGVRKKKTTKIKKRVILDVKKEIKQEEEFCNICKEPRNVSGGPKKRLARVCNCTYKIDLSTVNIKV